MGVFFAQQVSKQATSSPTTDQTAHPQITSDLVLSGGKKALAEAYSRTLTQLSTQSSTIERIKGSSVNMRIAIRELEREQEKGELRVKKLEEQVEQMSDALDKLILNNANQVTAVTVDPKTEKKRTNALNVSLVWHVTYFHCSQTLQSAISEVLYSLMDTDKSQDLPDPLTNPNAFWLTVDEEEHLRPKWDQSWSANIKWHSKFVKKFKADGKSLSPTCPPSVIDDITPKELKKTAGGTTFKNLKTKYKNQQKTTTLQAHDVTEDRRDDRKSKAGCHFCCACLIY
jgi:hypothetical protein